MWGPSSPSGSAWGSLTPLVLSSTPRFDEHDASTMMDMDNSLKKKKSGIERVAKVTRDFRDVWLAE